ncbi:DNA polymerase IV [Actinomycetaceae bacterium TAE3-ERU4]|nr:DNA polymerase IV [Actinomycetaceae bacterium TAE3-ERU4]
MSRAPRVSGAKVNWGTDDTGCNFLHVDMDSFFASVELLERPDLVGNPVVVGGNSARSVVCAATYEARKYGVSSAMPIARARSLCPQLVVLPVRHELYARVSAQVMEILREVTPEVEQVSIDEAFMDVSGARLRLGSSVQIATLIRGRIKSELGLSATVGIGAVKFISKIASTQAKPDGLLLVPKKRTKDFLGVLPIGAMWGVGPQTAARLESIGVRWVRDVWNLELSSLRSLLGNAAAIRLKELSQGVDERKIETSRERKSIGKEETFLKDIRDGQTLRLILLSQADELASRLRQNSILASTVSIKIRFSDFTTLNRSYTFPDPIDNSRSIYESAWRLLGQLGCLGKPVRLLGIRLENLHAISEGVQSLIGEDPKRRQLDTALDKVRGKFGVEALTSASLLSNFEEKETKR